MRTAAPIVFCTALLLAPCGCQRATQRIDREQTHIESHARLTIEELTKSIDLIETASETGEVGSMARAHLDQSLSHQRIGIAQQHQIAAAASRTRSRLTQVDDKVHPLLRLAQTWSIVAIVTGVIALLAYLGVGPLIRRGLQMIGLLIPKPVRTDAKFDAESIASGAARQIERERIAARRAADATYDRAFARAKLRRGEGGGGDVPTTRYETGP